MSQSGYTPVQLYRSTTAAAAPSAGNLAAGELAINTTDEKLYFKNTAGTVKVLATTGAGAAGGSTTQVQYNSSGVLAGSASFVFDGTNVGIGTASPSVKLSVTDSARASLYVATSDTGTSNQINFVNGSNFAAGTVGTVSGTGGSGGDVFGLGYSPAPTSTDFTPVLNWTSSGNVGIGTSSPTAISGYTALMLNNATNGSILDLAQGGTVRGRLVGTSSAFGFETNGALPFAFLPAGVEKMRLTDTGRLGIGTATPATTFDVNGASAGNVVAVSASAVDCATGNYFTKTASGALTWTFTNVPSSRSFAFALQLTNGGSGTQTWPAAVVWNGGTAPTLQTSGTDILVFVTSDSGTTWRGVRAWKQA